jgi:hypothetical protein
MMQKVIEADPNFKIVANGDCNNRYEPHDFGSCNIYAVGKDQPAMSQMVEARTLVD